LIVYNNDIYIGGRLCVCVCCTTHLPAGEEWRAEHRKKFETRTRSSVASKLMQRRGAELLVEPYRVGSIGDAAGGGGCGSWFGGQKQDGNSSGGGLAGGSGAGGGDEPLFPPTAAGADDDNNDESLFPAAAGGATAGPASGGGSDAASITGLPAAALGAGGGGSGRGPLDLLVRKTPFLPFYTIKKDQFCQDRRGTIIGKTLKTIAAFCAARGALPCLLSCRRPG
jgi:hypothetical protein